MKVAGQGADVAELVFVHVGVDPLLHLNREVWCCRIEGKLPLFGIIGQGHAHGLDIGGCFIGMKRQQPGVAAAPV